MIIKTNPGKVDDLIVRIANKNTIVGTQDKELKKLLKKKSIKIITIRQKRIYSMQ